MALDVELAVRPAKALVARVARMQAGAISQVGIERHRTVDVAVFKPGESTTARKARPG